MPRFTEETELHALAASVVLVLIGVTSADWFFTQSVMITGTALPAYWSTMILVGGLIITPVSGLAYTVRREVSTLAVWVVALAVPLATGSEDLAYTAIWILQPRNSGSPVWGSFPWLDGNPLVSWTNLVLGTRDVSIYGLFLSSLVGWLIVALVAYAYFED